MDFVYVYLYVLVTIAACLAIYVMEDETHDVDWLDIIVIGAISLAWPLILPIAIAVILIKTPWRRK